MCPCGKPAPAAYLCAACVAQLRRDLHTIAARWTDTLDVLARRTAFGGGAKGKNAEVSLPLDVHASAVRADAREKVMAWLQWLAGGVVPDAVRQPAGGVVVRADTVPLACEWLSVYLSGALLQPDVVQMAAQLGEVARKLHRLVDRPEAPTYLGRHACGADVWAKRHRSYQVCAGCDETIDLEALRSETTERARAVWATVSTIVRAASLYGVHITQQQISRWYREGALQSSYADDGRTLTFNVGRVVDLARLAEQRRAAV